MCKVYSVETKQLVCSLFKEFKSYREIEALTGVPRDVLRLWKARARNDEAWAMEAERKSLLSYEEKEEIVRLHSLGDSITDLQFVSMFIEPPLRVSLTAIVNAKASLPSVSNPNFLPVPLLIL